MFIPHLVEGEDDPGGSLCGPVVHLSVCASLCVFELCVFLVVYVVCVRMRVCACLHAFQDAEKTEYQQFLIVLLWLLPVIPPRWVVLLLKMGVQTHMHTPLPHKVTARLDTTDTAHKRCSVLAHTHLHTHPHHTSV